MVIAGPRYDPEHCHGEIIADSLALLPWAEHHSVSCWSNQEEEQAARKALPVWLRGADPSLTDSAYLPKPFADVLEPYKERLIEQGIVEFHCPRCGHSVDLDRKKLDERSELLDDRVGSRSTVITSQQPIEHWHTYLGDPTFADAILDRIVHAVHKLALKGESMRKKAAA